MQPEINTPDLHARTEGQRMALTGLPLTALTHARTEGPDRTHTLGRRSNAEPGTSWPTRPPHTSNGPTEAINGRLEHLRGTALDLRNHSKIRHPSTLETGGFRPQLHSPIMKSRLLRRKIQLTCPVFEYV